MEIMSMMRVSSKITKRISEYVEAKVFDEHLVLPTVQTINDQRLWNENQYEDLFLYFEPLNAVNQLEED
jgi:hypothetical protein